MTVFIATSVALLTAFAASPAAQASPGIADRGSATTSKGLEVAGFDAEVAAKNGYAIVTLPDGSRTSVRKELAESVSKGVTAPTGAILPPDGDYGTLGYDAEDGTCGLSWVRLLAMGSGNADLGTGFTVRLDWPGIWDINWRVNITDAGGSSQQTGYGAPSGTWTWSSTRILHLTPSLATAGIPFYSYVLLQDGTICYSLGPSTTEYIT
ncbi:hypothetical protein [Polymorphospora rubra]|uniref:Uncharacterized protein n=1 Tax=Polymorphospora rubra TaxID=338584 RepID=A0A810MYB0_9ACTN|nr:hypothetical protein [Polymorphospora rubra]BCJ66146.1 hypothetical protein Prubr_31670 [Polymorphospora rubra]